MTDLPPIERAIALQPGDTLIATLPADTTVDQFDAVRSALVDELDGIHVICVVGIDIGAYRPIRETS